MTRTRAPLLSTPLLNKSLLNKPLLTTLLCAGLYALAPGASAQTYPSKSVRVIIPAAPGGAVDTIGRVLAEKLGAALGQPFVPENMAGAGTMIGSEFIAKAAPDGYTLLVMTNSHTINAAVRKTLRYDPVKDFSTVAVVATLPDLLLVNPSVPANTVRELIDLALKSPGKITFASAGAGSGTHLDGELFKSLASIDILHVPYKGGTPAVTDLVGGHVQMMFSNPITAIAHVNTGRLRALGITSAKRSALLPNVPTIAEAAIPGYESGTWYGVLLPANTPVAIVNTLNREINKALMSPDVRKRINGDGGEVVGGTPQEFARYLVEDIQRWKKLVEANPKLRIDD